MVNPITATGSSWVPNRAPASPFTSTGRARFTNRGAVLRTCPATAPDPASGGRGGPPRPRSARKTTSGARACTSAPKSPAPPPPPHAPAGPRRRQEGVDHPALQRDVAIRLRGRLHPAAGPAGELAGRVRAPLHHPGDLVERHREHVVQDER